MIHFVCFTSFRSESWCRYT